MILSATALVLSCAAASAQDFSGPYAGGSLGYDWGDADVRYSVPADGGNARLKASDSFDVDGWDLGGYVGYRMATESGFLVAIEGGGLFSGASGTRKDVYGTEELKAELEKTNEFYVSAKAGIPVQNVAFVYGIAGVQTANFQGKVRNVGEGERLAKKEEYLGGWNLGLGAEYFLANNLSTRAEWKYQSYSDLSMSSSAGRAKMEPTENVLRLGVSYNF
jgi:outer membrane immunogenic protein